MSFESERPKPLVITGQNGAGKTNLISILADALIEGAAEHHNDVTTMDQGMARNWFRILGGGTQHISAQGGYAIVEFDDEGEPRQFVHKSGIIESPPKDSDALSPMRPWPEGSASHKEFVIGKEDSRRVYSTGIYAYFPVSRSEAPHWMNTSSLKSERINAEPRFSGRLGRGIFLEQNVVPLSNWISQVVLDSRPEVVQTVPGEQSFTIERPNFVESLELKKKLDRILQVILNYEGTDFRWISRNAGLHYLDPNTGSYLKLSALSSGQSTLLGIFGTLLWHGDLVSPSCPELAPGICIVD